MKPQSNASREREESEFYGGFHEDFERENRREQAREDWDDMTREDEKLKKHYGD